MSESARQRATKSLRVYAPEIADVLLSDLGHGLDNAAFLAGDLVVRVANGGDVAREARLLELVGPRVSVPVPAPRFADDARGVLAYPLLAGEPLLGRSAGPGLARRLGRFLYELHAIDLAELDDLVPTEDAEPAQWLADLDGPAELVRVVRANVPAKTRQRVLIHADLGAEHILAQDGALTGVIDWSDATITDPALDFARLYRDFGLEFLAETIDAYGGLEPAAGERITFFARCAALEDLVYGREHGRHEYAAAAQRSLTWLFPSDGQPSA